MRLQLIFLHGTVSEEAIQIPQFLLKVLNEIVPADDSSCIDVPQYTEKVNNCEDLCNYIYKTPEENHNNKD